MNREVKLTETRRLEPDAIEGRAELDDGTTFGWRITRTQDPDPVCIGFGLIRSLRVERLGRLRYLHVNGARRHWAHEVGLDDVVAKILTVYNQ